MAVVSLNLTEQAYSAYKQIPRGDRSRVLSALIAQRDFNQRLSGLKGTLLGPHGILEGMDVHTAGEAMIELRKIVERQSKVIAHLNGTEVIE